MTEQKDTAAQPAAAAPAAGTGQPPAPATAKPSDTGQPPAPATAKPPDTGQPQAAPPATPAAAPPSTDQAEAALKAFEETLPEEAPTEAPGGGPGDRLSLLLGGLRSMWRGFWHGFFTIRDEPTWVGRLLMAATCLGLLVLGWFLSTRPWWGPLGSERAVGRMTLGSPEEVFGSFGSLWFERALVRNLLASLWRVVEGFGLAIVVGVPLGVLCGTFRRIDAFFAPISLFGRNVPIAALVPLTLLFFGIDEAQKVAFIFMACVAFVMFDSARAIADVREDYLDTAYTLGATRWQALRKVLIPLALPDIFNSVRLLFGLAFGYIVLAEMVNADFGVGKLILVSQRRGPQEHVYLILIFITLVAFVLDRVLFGLQRVMFAYRYGRR